MTLSRDRIFWGAVALLALVPLVGSYPATVGVLAVVFGVVSLGFVVLTGWTGQLSLGQVLPYGLGGYAVALIGERWGVPVALAIPLAAVAVAPVAAIVGLAAERLRGLDLAIGTFALALMSQFLVFGALGRALTDEVAGTGSVVVVARPGIAGVDLSSNRSYYVFALVLGALVYLAVAALDRSRTGRELRAIGDDPVRAAVAGVPVARLRAFAFVVAGALAAVGGGILAVLREAVTPETFTAFGSLDLVAIAVVGGLGSIRGAVLAAIFGAVLPELARVDPFRFLQGRLTLVYGLALVVILIVKRGGIIALLGLDRRVPAFLGGEIPVPDDRPAVLQISGISVDYGATRAVDDVTVRVGAGEAVALVGPNGAGKSSLFDVVTGLLAPTEGRVFLGGVDVTDHRADQRVALGLGRTFQVARVFASLGVGENLLVAAHRAGRTGAAAVAADLLERLGLRDDEHRLPSELPFGSLRALEVGIALAGRPRVLLLDEPAAGLDDTEAAWLAEILERERERGMSVVLVEHDLAFVDRVADRVVVLDRGRVIADGAPSHVAADPVVIEAFLGTPDSGLRTETRRTRKVTAGARR